MIDKFEGVGKRRVELEKNSEEERERAFSEPVLWASSVFHLTDRSKPLMRWKLSRIPYNISV